MFTAHRREGAVCLVKGMKGVLLLNTMMARLGITALQTGRSTQCFSTEDEGSTSEASSRHPLSLEGNVSLCTPLLGVPAVCYSPSMWDCAGRRACLSALGASTKASCTADTAWI